LFGPGDPAGKCHTIEGAGALERDSN
jgi:hypothetical protein